MKAGTFVKYGNANVGLFLYSHEKNPKDDTLCSVLSSENKRITHVPYNGIESYQNTHSDGEDNTFIYEIENWYDIKRLVQPEGEGNCWVAIENNRLVYKGEILDIEFEMCVDEFFKVGIDLILVIDSKECVVFIYTNYSNIEEANKIINNIFDDKEDDEDYCDLDLSEILAMDPII